MHPSTRRPIAFAALTGGLLLAAVAPASAVSIDFHIGPPFTGMISYAGTGGPLTGDDISIDSVTGNGTPSNSSTFGCIGCTLNFSTGNLISSGPSSWLFSGANPSPITLTGSLDVDGDDTGDIPILMLGDMIGPSLTVSVLSGDIFDVGFTVGLFLDVKNAALTDFFGLPSFPSPYLGTLSVSWLGATDGDGGPIVATALGGTVTNTPLAATVPEPASVLLLGAGLLGLAGARRRASQRPPRG